MHSVQFINFPLKTQNSKEKSDQSHKDWHASHSPFMSNDLIMSSNATLRGSVRYSIYKTSFVIFWLTLILYLFTLIFAAYVGVYLTYVAIPVIVISGLFVYWFEPKNQISVEKTPEERLREIEERLEYLEK